MWIQWEPQSACKHPWSELIRRRLGNVALIGLLWTELKMETSRFPILLDKVLYNGVHSGDYLPFASMPALQSEVAAIGTFTASTPEAAAFVSQFRTQMLELELIAAAFSVRKPIAF